MKLLILGGTVFLGKHLTLAALAAGHSVTLFNRGKSRPNAFPDVEWIQGDREFDLGSLAGRNWDCVIDTCGYIPRTVRLSCHALKEVVGQYQFVSSVSVYSSVGCSTIDEGTEVVKLADPLAEQVTGETYGGLKALCEDTVRTCYEARSLIVRPGLIVGPDDVSDRFTYWPTRFAEGGDVLVPEDLGQPVQIIDVRDLAYWMIHMAESQANGTFNATGPEAPYDLSKVLEAIKTEVNPASREVPVSADFLSQQGVGAWMEMPLYLGNDPESWALMRADNQRALASGLRFRALKETVVDTLAWAASRDDSHVWKAGLRPARELELLSQWRASSDHA